MTEENKALRIIELRAENVKKLKAVTIRPEGNTVVIAGKNGAGKTSVLDSIWFALGGGRAMSETARPIREGQEDALVELDLGDYTVRRTWHGENSYLAITSKEGARYSSPQKFLDERIGDLSFDPLAFAQSAPRRQREWLLSLVSLPFNPEELAGQRLRLYEERTQMGREITRLQGQLDGLPDVTGFPAQAVSAADAVKALEEAQGEVDNYFRLSQQRAQVQGQLEIIAAQRAALDAEERDASERLRGVNEALAGFWPDGELSLPDLDALRNAVLGVEQHNEQVRLAERKRALLAEHTELQGRRADQTRQIEALDSYKAEALADAEMPVRGLGFDDEQVLYRGLPLAQASSAEQLRVSLGIAMADQPEIRVIRITDGSLLDSSNMRVIEEMAADRGYQVWIERVDESGTVGVVIEDGEVVG